ncbi:hypothetical protein LTR36_009912 [Oleoguttula mirabilis]|uniref:Myb-like DNA-binding domain-containing protein n=1 Tax=Oleoguttula mirabilis TaxID=1507867 RepID=A0AAV9J581_9PEZI|nr:hypothetical protein LTR36_009912 [Oleoguttula mirabilis]
MPPNTCKVTDLQFAMCCLNNIAGGAVDYDKVSDECGMSSMSAASQKLTRMKKAHSLSSADGSSAAASPAKSGGALVAGGTPKRAKKTPTKTGSAKKRKVDQDDDEEAQAKVKSEMEGDGED